MVRRWSVTISELTNQQRRAARQRRPGVLPSSRVPVDDRGLWKFFPVLDDLPVNCTGSCGGSRRPNSDLRPVGHRAEPAKFHPTCTTNNADRSSRFSWLVPRRTESRAACRNCAAGLCPFDRRDRRTVSTAESNCYGRWQSRIDNQPTVFGEPTEHRRLSIGAAHCDLPQTGASIDRLRSDSNFRCSLQPTRHDRAQIWVASESLSAMIPTRTRTPRNNLLR